jgi:hypothetical protein
MTSTPAALRTVRRCTACHHASNAYICPRCASTTWETYTDADLRAEDLSAEISAQLDERRTGIPRPAPPPAPVASREAAPVEPGALRAAKPARLRAFVLGMIVGLARQLHKLALEHGIGFSLAVSPQGATVFLLSGPMPEMMGARPVPHSDHVHVETDGVSVAWRAR